MNKPVVQILAVVIGIATAFAAFNFLKRMPSKTVDGKNLVRIGRIENIHGQVERRLPGSVDMESVPSPRPIYSQDLIVTQRGSFAVVVLDPEGPTLRINENSRFIAELDAAKPGAWIATLLDGTISILNPGRHGLFRLFKDGREVSLADVAQTLVPVIPTEVQPTATPGAGAAAPQPSATPAIVITATRAEDHVSPPASTPSPPGDAQPVENGGILSNEEIMRTLRSQSGLFQRCYLNFIHRTQSLSHGGTTGTIAIGFTIQQSGRASDSRVVRSAFKDQILHNCISEVVERARFRPFRGDPIPVQEFPISLQ